MLNILGKVSVFQGRINIEATILQIGNDYSIFVIGGDKPHIGATIIGNKFEAKMVVLSTHKENIICEKIFKELINNYNYNYQITCGIHLENITKSEIFQIDVLINQIIDKLIRVIR